MNRKKVLDNIPNSSLPYGGKVDVDANQIQLEFIQNVAIICQLER